MQLSQAAQGFFIHLAASGYSTNTIAIYRNALRKLTNYLNDPDLETITKTNLVSFLASLREDGLADNSINNAWIAIRSFYNWASSELDIKRPDADLPRPRFSQPEIKPFSASDLKRLLSACEYTAMAQTYDRQRFVMRRPTAKRDRAIVLTLLDTGLRVSELARLTMGDLDLTTGEVQIKPHGSGRKTKPRTVYLGKAARSALWRYLTTRDQDELQDPSTPLLVTEHNLPMDRNSIRLMIKALGSRANVHNVYPHRFRHTFAIQYLRNGGDVFTLQRLLGHSTLDMVKRYLAIADTDAQTAHQSASPVDRWKL